MNNRTSPNHALQRTAPRVTLAAADHPTTCAHPAPATLPQPARRAPQSLSLGSLGVARAHEIRTQKNIISMLSPAQIRTQTSLRRTAFIILATLLFSAASGNAQVTFVLKQPTYVAASSGDRFATINNQDTPSSSTSTYSQSETSTHSAPLANSNSFAELSFSIGSYTVTVEGQGNATATNDIFPNNRENASAASLFALNFTAPPNSFVNLDYDSSGIDAGGGSYFALEDIDTHFVVMHEPLGNSGSVIEFPLAAGHRYGFVTQVYVGAIVDGSLSGTVNYSYNATLTIQAPEPTTSSLLVVTAISGLLARRRRHENRNA